MSAKVKRKVTVENSKDSLDHPRRPSVFERLGTNLSNVPSQSQDRTSRVDQNEKCRNWLRTGDCAYGNTCRFQHDTFPSSSRQSKSQKDIDEKDLRYKMRSKRDETKDSRTGSLSPKRKESKRSRSRSRKGEHESKIKSTVVVTRPRSPTASQAESAEKEKKKADGSWEDDSDDWPMDATQLDYKEELTLERKRQQLQRELALELQKERMLNEKPSFSESSSTSSSSDSGSLSSSSDSTSSSSDEDSDESSSSSSSTSSSASQTPVKKKYKKTQNKKEPTRERDSIVHKKPLDDYDKIKSSRAAKSNWRPRSPASPEISTKKGRDRKNVSPARSFSPKRRGMHDSGLKAPAMQSGRKGPRTPSPSPVGRKQRQWGQSSSTDSRSADARKNRPKKHKKKKDSSRAERNRMDYVPTPPPLSSPNRTVLQPQLGKKMHQRDDPRTHHRAQEPSPFLLSRIGGQSNSPSMRHGAHYSEMDRFSDKQNQLKSHGRKSDDANQSRSRRVNSKERSSKHARPSPPSKDSHRLSNSPIHDKYESDNLSKRIYSPLSTFDKDENRRRNSLSPVRRGKDIKDRRKAQTDSEKRREVRDVSPRSHDNRRDNQYRNNEGHRKEDSREVKKGRDDKVKDRWLKDRNLDHDSWSDEPKKNVRVSDLRRPIDPPPPSQSVRGDRTRDRDRDWKKGKERDTLLRSVDTIERDRQRSSPPMGRVPPDLHPHHALRDDVSRGRIYEPEIPPDNREYSYSYVPHRETAYLDEHPLPPEYETTLRVPPPLYPPLDPVDYPPPGYSDSRYRRDTALKAVPPVPLLERIGTYSTRDISPLGPRDPVGLPVREEDYLADLPIDDRHAYDERWSRTRPVRDDWDPYAPPPAASLPPHVVADLDEDRHGMPRRRRASPDWMIRRGEERDMPLNREPRSRSPQHRRGDDINVPNRGSWGEHDRYGNRNSDVRQDAQQKSNLNQDDRKNRNNRRDHRDRNKRADEPPTNDTKTNPKEKPKEETKKRPHSPSPVRKDIKRRKEDITVTETLPVDNKSLNTKKSREESKAETKSSSSSRKIKSEPASPKTEVTIKVEKGEKEAPEKSSATKNSSKHEGDDKRKTNIGKNKSDTSARRNFDKITKSKKNGQSNVTRNKADDDFSDWSDGDDDLLNRDDFVEVSHRRGNSLRSESNSGDRVRSKNDESKKDKVSKSTTDSNTAKENEHKPKRDGSKDSRNRINELKSGSRSRTTSKERDCERLLSYSRKTVDLIDRNRMQNSKKTSTEVASGKVPNTQSQSSKESSLQEPVADKKDKDKADTSDFMTTENDDYDPISDEELEALIEEPDDSLIKADGNEELKIVDALDINWSTLMNETKSDLETSKARNRFKAVHVLSRIGFSQSLAGSHLSQKITQFCQNQLDEEQNDENQDTSRDENNKSGARKFVMEHPVASFHVSLTQKKKERQEVFNRIGPSRRALCARQDLHIRKLLCRPVTNLVVQNSSRVQKYNSSDAEISRSPELKKIGCSAPIINAAC